MLDLTLALSDIHSSISPSSFSVLPSRADFDAELQVLRSYTPHPALSIIDPIIPISSSRQPSPSQGVFDSSGLTPAARTRIALSRVIASDRRLIKDNVWAVQHLLALESLARDRLAMSNQPNPLFSDHGGVTGTISNILTSVQQTLAYAMSTLASDLSRQWHADLTAALKKNKSRPEAWTGLGHGLLADTVADVFWGCSEEDFGKASLDSRVLHGLLRGLLREVTTEESDMWLVLAQAYLDSCELSRS